MNRHTIARRFLAPLALALALATTASGAFAFSESSLEVTPRGAHAVLSNAAGWHPAAHVEPGQTINRCRDHRVGTPRLRAVARSLS